MRRELADDLDEPGVADLVDRLRGAVDRVLRRGVGRQERHQPLLQFLFEHRQFEPVRRQDVGHPNGTAARAGDHRHPVALWQFAEGEGGGDVEHVVEVFAADDPVMAKDRLVDRPRMRERAGMRGGGAAARLGATDFGEDQGFAGGGGLVGDRAEAGRVADALEIGEENVGAARVDQPIDIVVRFETNLVAGAGLVGKAQLPRPATAHEGEGERAALAADRDRPAPGALRKEALFGIVKHRAERRDQRLQWVDDALGVRPADDDAVAVDDLAQRLIARLRRLAALFGEAGADHDRRAHPLTAAFRQCWRDIGGRHDDNREVRRLRQIGDARVAFQPENLGLAARHRIDATGIAMRDQELRRAAAQAVGVR